MSRNKRLFCLFIALFICRGTLLLAQSHYRASSPSILELKSTASTLSLDVLAEGFFLNNEYTNEVETDYTLPGYRAISYLNYLYSGQQLMNFKFGVEHLHYWGASRYPVSLYYKDLPYWHSEGNDYRRWRWRPYFQTAVRIDNRFAVILGSLEGGCKHRLIEPLYKPELNLSTDNESGAQIKYQTSETWADIWIDWQSFIFGNDRHQEAFISGFNVQRRLFKREELQLQLELASVIGHRGGKQNLTPDTVHTWLNSAIGLKLEAMTMLFDRLSSISSSCYLLGYLQRGEHFPSDGGYGFYWANSLSRANLNLELNLWYGQGWMSNLGTPFALAINGEGYFRDEDRRSFYLQSRLSYALLEKQAYSLGLATTMYLNPLLEKKISSSIELYISVNPQFKFF